MCVYSVIVGYSWYCIFNRAGSSISVAISILFDGENISFHSKPVSLLNNLDIFNKIFTIPHETSCIYY